eukprot:NODE_45_length_32908_cov_0.790271.p6 type:complete len:442 gc:universal NODE_45_length_32908_cov_0.790271:7881-9206(+)
MVTNDIMILATLILSAFQPHCSNPRIRKEFRQLSDNEWSDLRAAFHKLKYSGRLTEYAKLHNQEATHIHFTMEFLTWHRTFLWSLETELRQAIGSDTLTIPYIDYAYEGDQLQGQIEQSSAFQTKFYGTFLETLDQCVVGQIYDSFVMSEDFNMKKCLYRQMEESVSVSGWASLDQMIFTSSSYGDFSENIENSIHGYCHLRTGGYMTSMFSPIDPTFYAVHGFIDMAFLSWQYVHDAFNDQDKSVASKTFTIFGHTQTHRDSYTMKNQCVSYERYGSSAVNALPLKKRDDTSTTPTSTGSEEAATTEAVDFSQYEQKPYKTYSPDEIKSFNDELDTYYLKLKGILKSGSETDLYKEIAGFHPNSYIAINNHPSDDLLAQIGLKPDIFNKVNQNLNQQRLALAQFGNFTVNDLLAQVTNSMNPSSGSTLPMILGILFILFQ